jgi:tetratricopeptide (TPR) repeat protein
MRLENIPLYKSSMTMYKKSILDNGPGMRKGFIFFVIIFILLGTSLLYSQYIDPFYRDLLLKGESSYLSGNYKDAVRQLKTSLFGIMPNKELRAKALVYLSLCHYYLKESTQSRDYLSQAIELMGEEGFANLGLMERIKGEISGVAAHFRLGEFMVAPELEIIEKPELSTLSDPQDPSGSNHSIKELEDSIETNPSNVSAYYDLYELYLQGGNRSKARKILENLVDLHPDEIQGYYLLGQMRFRDKKYKDAEAYFREALKPRPGFQLSNELKDELKTYHILSVYQMGDKAKALDMMAVSVHLYTEAYIRSLSISGQDKVTLRQIIREYMKR